MSYNKHNHLQKLTQIMKCSCKFDLQHQLTCRYHLKDAVVEGGIPFNKAFGMTAFEYPGTDPRFNKVFNQGMFDHSTIIMNKILETYTGFNALTSLVDVGGGIGATLQMILSKYPMIKGINFDLPHVVKEAPTYPGKKNTFESLCCLMCKLT